MNRVLHRAWAGDGVRFVVAGVFNTALTLALYELFLFVLPPWIAYSFSWLGGLLFVVIFYPSRVFAGARRDLRARASFGASYVAVFIAGLLALEFLQARGVAPRISIFAVLVVTTTANFVFGRLILTNGSRR